MLRGIVSALLLAVIVVISGQRSPPVPPPLPPVTLQNIRQVPLPVLEDTKNLTFVVSATNLPNKDFLDTVDPFVKVYCSNKSVVEPVKFGSTEVSIDSVNPEFNKVFWFIWKRGGEQKWLFRVRDQDDLQPDDPLGEVTVQVDDYVAKGEKLNVSLSDGGFLQIQKTTPTKFKILLRDVPRSDPFSGKSDPYVTGYWSRGVKGHQVQFFTTEVANDVENVDFNQTLEFANYIPGTDQWWTFKIFDSDGVKDDSLGEVLVEVDPFVEKRATKVFKFGDTAKATLGVVPVA